jgi:hypothetical protein
VRARPIYTCGGCGLGVFVARDGDSTRIIRACPCAPSTTVIASGAFKAKGVGGIGPAKSSGG